MPQATKILLLGSGDALSNATLPKLFYLADATAAAGFDTHIATPDHVENRLAHSRLSAAVTPHWLIESSRSREALDKHLLIRRLRPDIVQVVGIGLRSLTMFGRPLNIPILIHDYDEWVASWRGLSKGVRASYRGIEAYTRMRAHAIVVASQALFELVGHIRPDLGDRLLRLPIGFDPAIQVPVLGLKESIAARLGGRPALVYVGTIQRRYDQDELLGLGARLEKGHLTPVIIVVGGGPDFEEFERSVEAMGLRDRIWLEGWVKREEVGTYLDVADVLLFPFPPSDQNLYRCPTKAFQYAAANRPVVTNAVGEVHRLLGDAGFYYPPQDPDGLFEATSLALTQSADYNRPEIAEGTTWRDRGEQYVSWLMQSIVPLLTP